MNAFMGVRHGSDGEGVWNVGGGRTFEDLLHHIMMNDSSHAGVPPASERLIESLSRLQVTEETDLQELGECCISQEAFEIGELAVCLPCKHSYKEEPIIHWLKMHNTCPVCRIQLPAPEENVQGQESTLID
jgi:E3 ubiquitin-protein ligase RNF115/126